MVAHRSRSDVVIVGGGVIGSSCAYHLKKLDPNLEVVVVERDPSYRYASSARSAGNARVQFSLERNIQISLYTFEVLETFGEEMEVDGTSPDVGFRAEGNLFLVDDHGRHAAREAVERQRKLGGCVNWLETTEIERRWPLLDARSFCGGTFGARDGYLDGYSFLIAYRNKARSLGVTFVEAEVVELESRGNEARGVRLASGARLEAPCVLCSAGAWTSPLLETIGVTIPVEPVQRQAFLVETEVRSEVPLPLINLPSGFYCRSEGDERILVGRSMVDDPVGDGFAWSEERFNKVLWPELVSVVPKFDRLRLAGGWTGLYAVNRLDGNAILGLWPEMAGLFLACGFSGHGLQQAPAVGRYLSELIVGVEPSLDLSIFSAERLFAGEPLTEIALI